MYSYFGTFGDCPAPTYLTPASKFPTIRCHPTIHTPPRQTQFSRQCTQQFKPTASPSSLAPPLASVSPQPASSPPKASTSCSPISLQTFPLQPNPSTLSSPTSNVSL